MDPGLCASCRHAGLVKGARTGFWFCGRSREQPEYPRYPRLPVLSCPGHEEVTEQAPQQPAPSSD